MKMSDNWLSRVLLLMSVVILTTSCSNSDNTTAEAQTPAAVIPAVDSDEEQPADEQPADEQPSAETPAEPVEGQPLPEQGPAAGDPESTNPDAETPENTPTDPPAQEGLAPAVATGADTSGREDDSPTVTESLSLVGPFIKDPSRGAGPPSVPAGLTALMAAGNWVEFSWAPSTDDQSVEAYEIYRDAQLIATVRGDTGYEHDYRSWISTSFIDCNYTRYAQCEDQNLQPQNGSTHAYSVVAVDNEGMRSAASDEVLLSMATDTQSGVDLSGYQPVFREEFNDTKLDRARWKTSLPWGPDTIVNGETQYFVNTFGSEPFAYDPFVMDGDTLKITGINTPPELLAQANNQPYLSGVITTSDYFRMTYGYVEMRAKLAPGQGILSTFYLFNQDFEKNQPEIDVVEYLGARSTKTYQTYHYYDSNRARTPKGEKHSSPTMETETGQNLSDDFHTFGVLWEQGSVVWYIDGVEVRRLEGVRVSDEPMNIIAHMVMGSNWIGEPDPGSVPAVFEIDYIRAWQKP